MKFKKNFPALCLLIGTVLISCSKNAKALSNDEVEFSQKSGEEFIQKFNTDYEAESEKQISISKDEAVKNLANLKTKYHVKKINLNEAIRAMQAALEQNAPSKSDKNQKKTKKAKQLKVETWGPQGEIPEQMENVEFYVSFSQPVHELKALDEVITKCNVMEISPKVKGVYKWKGTRDLAFICEEALDPGVEYSIKVNKNLKSLDGVKISGETEFKTSRAELAVRDIEPGSTIKNPYFNYSSYRGIPLENAGNCFIKVNQKISAENFSSSIRFICDNLELNYSVIPAVKTEIGYAETKNKTENFFVEIHDALRKDSEIEIAVLNKESERIVEERYYTLRSFVINNVHYENYSKTIVIYANQNIDKNTVKENISFSPQIKFSDGDIEVDGSTIRIRNTKVVFGEKYECKISGGLKDVFGQTLKNGIYSNEFTVPHARSYMKMLDYGNKILEAQFPHKFIIEHQNLIDGKYFIENVDDPLSRVNSSYADAFSGEKKSLMTGKQDMLVTEEIELDPYLKNGLGFIRLVSEATVNEWDYWDNCYNIWKTGPRNVTIQVTDLGVTARVSRNKVAAMVRTLSTNKPVENARVYIYENDNDYVDPKLTEEYSYGYGVTDKNGYVEFPYRYAGVMLGYKTALFVQKDDDKVTFNVNNHAAWRFSVHTRSFGTVDAEYLTFMFTDRGIYRPGETVSFRGISRTQYGDDLYSEYNGKNCTVIFECCDWERNKEYERCETCFSNEGGVNGSFDIPKDAEPGTYRIRVCSGRKTLGSTIFKVAYFEKLKIQASAKIPDLKYYLGDKLTAELSASYLAGGALTGASYSVNWYAKPVDFVPDTTLAKDYIFGPSVDDNSSFVVSSSGGSVNQDGVTRLSCSTNAGYSGQAYQYRAEIGVTDISNQRIFTGAAKIVHPAEFYIGLQKRFDNGYPSAKQKVNIPFVFTDTDGKVLDASKINGNIEYSISRTSWVLSHEDSVDGIYSRWEREDTVIESKEIPASQKGSIVFTPEKAGMYTVGISAKDKKGRTARTSKVFYVTGADYSWFDSSNSTGLRLTPDKNKYKPGDTAKLLLESPLPSGDYLITVERSDIYSSEVRHFDSSCTQIEIPVKEEYLPVFYVTVCSYSTRKGAPKHQYGQPDLDKPKGYFGVTPVFVDLASVTFDITVTPSKKVYRPAETATFNLLATKDGKPVPYAELTLMVVDRAVVDLINYHVNDPVSYFYNPSLYPLSVIGGDSRGYLMDPVTYKVKTLQGGDSDESKEMERKDFRPTALFEPVIVTDENGKATVSVKLPDSLTTYRVTAFGVSKNNFALNESEIQAQNPINVQSVQPRLLRIRDTAECGIIATNLDTKPHDVTVELSIRKPEGNYESDKAKGLSTVAGEAFVDGNSTQTIKVPAGKTLPVYFKVAASAPGSVELVYKVKSDLINEKMISVMNIEDTFVYETVTTTGVVESASFTKKDKQTETEKVILPSWAKSNSGSVEVTIDPSQIGSLGSAVKYVFDYPYGCLEQQSSRIWPLLIFGEYIDTFGLKSNVSDIDTLITSWFAKVKNEQKYDGGFPYWPGGDRSDEYISLRFAHMHSIARKNRLSDVQIGYSIERLMDYLVEKKNTKKPEYKLNVFTAYEAYVFSLFGDDRIMEELDALYGFIKKTKTVPATMLAYTGLAYKHFNKNDRAKEMADLLKQRIVPEAKSASITGLDNGYYNGMYDNKSEAYASAIQLYVELDPTDRIIDKLLFTLLLEQKAGYWQNTATTARVFEAIRVLIEERHLNELELTGYVTLKTGTEENCILQKEFKGAGSKAANKIVSFDSAELKSIERNKPFEIEFTKDGKGFLYYMAKMSYAIPDELYASRDEGFEVTQVISDEDGNIIKPISEDSSVVILDSGKLYTVETTVSYRQPRWYGALRVPVPSGVEIVDTSLSTGASKNTSGDVDTRNHVGGYDYSYDDYWWDDFYPVTNSYYKDNEACFFSNYLYGSTWKNTITIRAVRKGVYPTPPAHAECMYEPEIFGRTDGYLYIVK